MSTVLEDVNTRAQGATTLITVTPQTVQQITAGLMSLTIKGVDDKAGALAVRAGIRACIKLRSTLDAEHRAAKADALAECRRIDQMKTDIKAMIAPIEKHLVDQEEAIAAELARVEKERQDAIYAERVKAFAAIPPFGIVFPEHYLRGLSAAEFESLLAKTKADEAMRVQREEEAKKAAEEQEARLAAEREQQRIEREKLEAERAELNRQRAEQEAEAARLRKIEDDRRAEQQRELNRQQAELDKQRLAQEQEAARLRKIEDDRIAAEQAEQRRKDAEEAERVRQAELKRAQEEAAERAMVETEARIKREAAEAEAERLREESMRPDMEKLASVADQIQSIAMPAVGAESVVLLNTVNAIVGQAVIDIRAALKFAKKSRSTK